MTEDLPDINQGISKPELFKKFKMQLSKDFETCGLSAGFCEGLTPDYCSIHKIILSEISGINKKISGKLNELLYRIDVSELQIRKLAKQKPESEPESVIAELIIKRILQKVVYREYFK